MLPALPANRLKKLTTFWKKPVKRQKLKVVFLDVDCLYVRFPLIRYYDSLFAPFVFHARWKNLKPRDFYLAPGVRTQDVTKGINFPPKFPVISRASIWEKRTRSRLRLKRYIFRG